MQNIFPLDFIDTSRMAASLLMRHEVHFQDETRRQSYAGSPYRDTQTIFLRSPADGLAENWFQDVGHEDAPLLAEWPAARDVLAHIAESHRRRTNEEAVFGKVMVEQLKAGGAIGWQVSQTPYANAYARLHACLVPSPGAFLYSGGDGAILPPGQLSFVNTQTWHSAINLGPVARTHLIVDVRHTARQTEAVKERLN